MINIRTGTVLCVCLCVCEITFVVCECVQRENKDHFSVAILDTLINRQHHVISADGTVRSTVSATQPHMM